VKKSLLALLGVIVVLAGVAAPASAAAPVIEPIRQDVPLGGSPFAVVPTPSGKFAFSSQSGSVNGIAVLRQEGTQAELVGTIPTTDPAYGMTITHDGEYLLAAVQGTTKSASLPAGVGVVVIDVRKAIAEEPEPILGYIPVTAGSGPVNVEVSNDDRFAFVADELNETVGVIDLEAATTVGVAPGNVVGYIPVANLPVGLAPSPDGHYLYVTNEWANSTDPGYDPTACNVPTEGVPSGTPGPEGSLTVVNLREAETHPETSVISTTLAGCQPVRVNLSNDGAVAWVTDRSDDEIAAYGTERLLTDPTDALISRTPVGVAPVGLQFFDEGQLIAVANSNRFGAGGQNGTVSIVNARRALRGTGESATLATFTAGEFPRQLAPSPDGGLLYLTEFSSNTLAVLPVAELLRTVHPVAEFELALRALGDGSGSFGCKVDGGPEEACQAEYATGSEVEVVPHAATGSTFVEWVGDCDKASSCDLKIAADKRVGAIFEKVPAPPSVGGTGSGGNGLGSTGPGGSPKPTRVKVGRAPVHGSSASLPVTVSAAGTITVTGKGVVAAKRKVKGPGTVTLRLKLTDASKRSLARRSAVRIEVKIVFTVTDGSRRKATRTVVFEAKHHT
jgi:DNA-binding beta-propeller fold protein YncE